MAKLGTFLITNYLSIRLNNIYLNFLFKILGSIFIFVNKKILLSSESGNIYFWLDPYKKITCYYGSSKSVTMNNRNNNKKRLNLFEETILAELDCLTVLELGLSSVK